MSIEVRPEPSFRVDAIMTPAKDLPHLAHTAVVEQAAILGGKQNLPTSSDKREGIAVNLDATGSQDVARLGSHNPTVQHAEEMETRSDESSGLDMPMAAGLAGMMLLHGRTGMKDRMTVMSRRIRGLPQGPPSETKLWENRMEDGGWVSSSCHQASRPTIPVAVCCHRNTWSVLPSSHHQWFFPGRSVVVCARSFCLHVLLAGPIHVRLELDL